MCSVLNSLPFKSVFHDFEFGFWRLVIFFLCYHVTMVFMILDGVFLRLHPGGSEVFSCFHAISILTIQQVDNYKFFVF